MLDTVSLHHVKLAILTNNCKNSGELAIFNPCVQQDNCKSKGNKGYRLKSVNI